MDAEARDTLDEVSDAGDADADADVCGDYPKHGCPCDPSTDESCCIVVGEGLDCTNIGPPGTPYRWSGFFDCGCIPDPDWCAPGEYVLYDLCPRPKPGGR